MIIDGNTSMNELLVNELSGGARIGFVFHELYNNGVDQVKDGDIRTLLYNSSVRGMIHISERSDSSSAFLRVRHQHSLWARLPSRLS
jgi:hypothetical protein